MKKPRREDVEKVCRMFGNAVEDVFTPEQVKAFADVAPDQYEEIAAEMPAPVIEEEVVEEAPAGEEDALIERLKAVADNEETSKEDKKTAEELIARLEDLATAKKNAIDFLAEKEATAEPPAEEVVAEVEVPAEEAPPAVTA